MLKEPTIAVGLQLHPQLQIFAAPIVSPGPQLNQLSQTGLLKLEPVSKHTPSFLKEEFLL